MIQCLHFVEAAVLFYTRILTPDLFVSALKRLKDVIPIHFNDFFLPSCLCTTITILIIIIMSISVCVYRYTHYVYLCVCYRMTAVSSTQ